MTTAVQPGTVPTDRRPVAPAAVPATGPAPIRLPRHLLSAGDLDRATAEHVLSTAERIEQAIAGREVRKLPTLRGRTVVNLFFEDSTRTRISFELAAKRLSADVITFSAKGSSVSKGESLKDTAWTLQAMGADAVVCRHSSSGRPATALGLGGRSRDQRRRRHARAPDAGPAGRLHPAPASRRAGRPADRGGRRRAAFPRRQVQRAAAVHPGRRGDPGRAADAAAGRCRSLAGRRSPTTSTPRWSVPTP